MLNLTTQEKKVLMFLFFAALVSIGVNFASKKCTPVENFLDAQDLVKVNLNEGSYEELVKGRIAKSLAKNIIIYRKTCGAFRNWDELKEVKGIGEYRLRKLQQVARLE